VTTTSPKVLKYRKEAERVMAEAAKATDQRTRDTLSEIAQQYDRLAAWPERQQSTDPE
jgi:hypothetical protein